MKKSAILLLSLLMATTLLISSFSCAVPEQKQTLDQQAQEIYRSLMCPLCPGRTIDQSQTELSNQMRSLVREKLEHGESREEILQFFVERYGETVLAAPVKSGFNLIVWITPIIAIFIGGIVLWVIIRRRVNDKNKSFSEQPFSSSVGDYDDKYHEQLEKDLKDFDERGFR